jgi:predicted phosphodiesterase
MRIYFFGDIHGNEYALDACIKHSQSIKADQIYCLGDIVGWLPFGDRTLTRMKTYGFSTVAGNHDLLVAGLFTDFPQNLDRIQASAYNAGLLSTVPGSIDYLLSLPLTIEKDNFIIVHHSPFHLPSKGDPPTIRCFEYLTRPVLDSCLEAWNAYPKHIIFSGHDHIPVVYELPGGVAPAIPEHVKVHKPSAGRKLTVRLNPHSRYWVKAGSVGGPYRDGVPAANAVLYDTTEETITLFRLPFPTERLYRELGSHFFAPTLPTMRDYLALLAKHLPPDATDGGDPVDPRGRT